MHPECSLMRNSFEVVVTVRSEEKGQRILQSLDETLRPRVSFAVVGNVAEEGAFDHVRPKSSLNGGAL